MQKNLDNYLYERKERVSDTSDIVHQPRIAFYLKPKLTSKKIRWIFEIKPVIHNTGPKEHFQIKWGVICPRIVSGG